MLEVDLGEKRFIHQRGKDAGVRRMDEAREIDSSREAVEEDDAQPVAGKSLDPGYAPRRARRDLVGYGSGRIGLGVWFATQSSQSSISSIRCC